MSLSTLIAQVKSINSTRQDVGAAFDEVQSALDELNTNWLDWTPTYGAGGSMTFTSVSTTRAVYKVLDNIVFGMIRFSGTTGGTASNSITASAPIAGSLSSSINSPCYIRDGSTRDIGIIACGNPNLTFYLKDLSSWGIGSNREASCFFFYEI